MNDNLPDQKQLWDEKHASGDHDSFQDIKSTLANIVTQEINPNSYILELGCGVGRDAYYFAQNGHKVIATDLSQIVINKNQERLQAHGLSFEVLDILNKFPYKDNLFDVVHANLSLHYYKDKDTKRIIGEIHRVLRKGGKLAFSCKSTNDPHYGKGDEVEDNLFISSKGHVRHLFTLNYVNELLDSKFKTELLEEVKEEYNKVPSSIIRCIATKVL